MKSSLKVALCLMAGLCLVATTVASPVINGAVINTRVFNDYPNSIVTTNNAYPGQISIQDDGVGPRPPGFANRHNFRLSDSGGAAEAVFLNGDAFSLAADVTVTGSADWIESGLNVSPWWSKEVDGTFMLKTSTGEIAVFGGRLPFYSFTASQGLTYTKGTTVREEVIYNPHSLNQADPGTIVYNLTMGGTTYTSGVLQFDEGNPAEDPPYGLWGILNDARVGGYIQIVGNETGGPAMGAVEFDNIVYTPEPASLALFGLAALAAFRRR